MYTSVSNVERLQELKKTILGLRKELYSLERMQQRLEVRVTTSKWKMAVMRVDVDVAEWCAPRAYRG